MEGRETGYLQQLLTLPSALENRLERDEMKKNQMAIRNIIKFSLDEVPWVDRTFIIFSFLNEIMK